MSLPYFLHTFLYESKCDPDLAALFSYIGRAGKYVVHAIRHDNLGLAGSKNVQGENQMALDVIADNIFCQHLKESNLISQFVSEEQEEAIELMKDNGKFSVVFDPLDGSSLIDTNLSIGTVFGIYQNKSLLGKTPRKMVAAGYILYGPRTTMTCSIGTGVHEFILNDLGEFQISRENIQIENEAKMFAPGNLRATKDREEYQKLVTSWMLDQLTLRYSGGMVPDINSIFSKEQGIFVYPSSEKYPQGKLRLLYECAPIAYLMEQAGGSAKTEAGQDILDICIEDIHQRSSFVVGSKNTVEAATKSLQNK